MSLLDVSFVLDDPLFAEPAIWIQRAVVTGPDGRTAFTETEIPIQVVPNSGDGDVLRRGTDGSTVYSTVRFYSRAPMSPGNHGTDADRVRWRGRLYQAISVGDWSNYGEGFTSTSCELVLPDGGVEAPLDQ